jgi:hypothetical protein
VRATPDPLDTDIHPGGHRSLYDAADLARRTLDSGRAAARIR